jgi:nucleoside-diphosphate-sugar epimerase
MRNMTNPTILIIGACGQIGTELTVALRMLYGVENVIASDRHFNDPGIGNYEELDIMDSAKVKRVVASRGVTQIYLLAAILSASGEKDANATWNLNMKSLIAVLNIARDLKLEKVFWPSSIAVFGPGSPKYNCPQETRMEPITVYGISKRAGEYWCNYYHDKYGVDVRSIRFPGLISNSSSAVGCTTDYVVEIFHEAIENNHYECFLEESTVLPMLYMKDAIRAVLELMAAPAENINIRTSYNIAGMSFAPCDLVVELKKHLPSLEVIYLPDHRQAIADSWPASINDANAKADWGWSAAFNISTMTYDILKQLGEKRAFVQSKKTYPDFQTEDVAAI